MLLLSKVQEFYWLLPKPTQMFAKDLLIAWPHPHHTTSNWGGWGRRLRAGTHPAVGVGVTWPSPTTAGWLRLSQIVSNRGHAFSKSLVSRIELKSHRPLNSFPAPPGDFKHGIVVRLICFVQWYLLKNLIRLLVCCCHGARRHWPLVETCAHLYAHLPVRAILEGGRWNLYDSKKITRKSQKSPCKLEIVINYRTKIYCIFKRSLCKG